MKLFAVVAFVVAVGTFGSTEDVLVHLDSKGSEGAPFASAGFEPVSSVAGFRSVPRLNVLKLLTPSSGHTPRMEVSRSTEESPRACALRCDADDICRSFEYSRSKEGLCILLSFRLPYDRAVQYFEKELAPSELEASDKQLNEKEWLNSPAAKLLQHALDRVAEEKAAAASKWLAEQSGTKQSVAERDEKCKFIMADAKRKAKSAISAADLKAKEIMDVASLEVASVNSQTSFMLENGKRALDRAKKEVEEGVAASKAQATKMKKAIEAEVARLSEQHTMTTKKLKSMKKETSQLLKTNEEETEKVTELKEEAQNERLALKHWIKESEKATSKQVETLVNAATRYKSAMDHSTNEIKKEELKLGLQHIQQVQALKQAVDVVQTHSTKSHQDLEKAKSDARQVRIDNDEALAKVDSDRKQAYKDASEKEAAASQMVDVAAAHVAEAARTAEAASLDQKPKSLLNAADAEQMAAKARLDAESILATSQAQRKAADRIASQSAESIERKTMVKQTIADGRVASLEEEARRYAEGIEDAQRKSRNAAEHSTLCAFRASQVWAALKMGRTHCQLNCEWARGKEGEKRNPNCSQKLCRRLCLPSEPSFRNRRLLSLTSTSAGSSNTQMQQHSLQKSIEASPTEVDPLLSYHKIPGLDLADFTQSQATPKAHLLSDQTVDRRLCAAQCREAGKCRSFMFKTSTKQCTTMTYKLLVGVFDFYEKVPSDEEISPESESESSAEHLKYIEQRRKEADDQRSQYLASQAKLAKMRGQDFKLIAKEKAEKAGLRQIATAKSNAAQIVRKAEKQASIRVSRAQANAQSMKEKSQKSKTQASNKEKAQRAHAKTMLRGMKSAANESKSKVMTKSFNRQERVSTLLDAATKSLQKVEDENTKAAQVSAKTKNELVVEEQALASLKTENTAKKAMLQRENADKINQAKTYANETKEEASNTAERVEREMQAALKAAHNNAEKVGIAERKVEMLNDAAKETNDQIHMERQRSIKDQQALQTRARNIIANAMQKADDAGNKALKLSASVVSIASTVKKAPDLAQQVALERRAANAEKLSREATKAAAQESMVSRIVAKQQTLKVAAEMRRIKDKFHLELDGLERNAAMLKVKARAARGKAQELRDREMENLLINGFCGFDHRQAEDLLKTSSEECIQTCMWFEGKESGKARPGCTEDICTTIFCNTDHLHLLASNSTNTTTGISVDFADSDDIV